MPPKIVVDKASRMPPSIMRSSIAKGDERFAKQPPSSPALGQSPPADAAVDAAAAAVEAPPSSGQSPPAAAAVAVEAPPSSPTAFSAFSSFFGASPSKEPKDGDPASAAAVSVSVTSSSPELAPRLAAVTAELDALRARHESLRTESAAEADSLRERLVAETDKRLVQYHGA